MHICMYTGVFEQRYKIIIILSIEHFMSPSPLSSCIYGDTNTLWNRTQENSAAHVKYYMKREYE